MNITLLSKFFAAASGLVSEAAGLLFGATEHAAEVAGLLFGVAEHADEAAGHAASAHEMASIDEIFSLAAARYLCSGCCPFPPDRAQPSVEVYLQLARTSQSFRYLRYYLVRRPCHIRCRYVYRRSRFAVGEFPDGYHPFV